MTAENLIDVYRAIVDSHLDRMLPQDSVEPVSLAKAMRYAALAPGKRLRPALLLATYRAVSNEEPTPNAFEAACAVELVHCFSLIHDDLPAIDDDDLRRGRPTVHKVFGEALAILAGDALFATAFEAIARTGSVRTVELLARASGPYGLVGGEVMDVEAEGRSIGLDALRIIHQRKTGALISASCEIGAVLAGATDAVLSQIRSFAEEVGIAFQIADDILNETSTSSQLGKSAGSDKMRLKATYPAVVGLAESRVQAERHLKNAANAVSTLGANDLLLLARYSVDRLT